MRLLKYSLTYFKNLLIICKSSFNYAIPPLNALYISFTQFLKTSILSPRSPIGIKPSIPLIPILTCIPKLEMLII